MEIFFDVTGTKEGEFYQFIVNPNGAISDLKTSDGAWNAQGEGVGVQLNEDSWTLEVFLQYTAFPDRLRPETGVEWFGQITRHRISDSKTNADSKHEYSRMNCKFGGRSASFADVAPVIFIE